MLPGKLTGIVRAQCSVACTARGDGEVAAAFYALDAEVAAAGLCKESSWMAAKHVTISYKALAKIGSGQCQLTGRL